MPIKYYAILLASSVMLSGCNKQVPTAGCSSPDTQKQIDSLLTEQAVKLTTEKRYDQYDGSFTFGATKIRAELAKIQITVENIKIVSQEPDSSKSICNGLLKITVPATMLNEANQSRNALHESVIPEYAKSFNIQNDSNLFTKNLEYSVKPTGIGKAPLVELKSTEWAHLLDGIITAILLRPNLDVQETFIVQEVDPQKQAIKSIKPEEKPAENETESIRVMQEKQGLAKLNAELLEAEQAEKELSHETKAPISQPVASQSLSSDAVTKQTNPSFNCSKATKPAENTICANSELIALDIENAQIYKKARAIDPVATNTIWKESIHSKYACGINVDCIATVYKKSIRNYECVVAETETNCISASQ
jgi:hypothetical protein